MKERRLKKRNNLTHKILICDDDRDICELISNSLKKINCVCEVSYSCKDCIEKIKDKFFKVIILDNVFPDGKGVDLISDIKDIAPATKVIIMTGYQIMDDKLKALNYGAGYIEKPFNISNLLTKLKIVLSE